MSTALDLVTPLKKSSKKIGGISAEQFERLTVVEQVVHALKPGGRIAALMGLVMGGCAPAFTFGIVHFALPSHPGLNIILWIIVGGGLLFSAPKVFKWFRSAMGSNFEALGAVMFLEGIMTFAPGVYLPASALTVLVFINAIYSACRLQIKK